MIQSQQEGINHKYFRALTLGLSFMYVGCKGLMVPVPKLEQRQKEATEEEEPYVTCSSELQTIWNLPGGP